MNPILLYRKRERLTQAQLAGRLNISTQTVRRAEQGTFNYLPPAFINGLPDHLNLAEEYESWRVSKRNAYRHLAPRYIDIQQSTGVGEHPFYYLRLLMMREAKERGIIRPNIKLDSVAGFAKLVAIDPEAVWEFEASYQEAGFHIRTLLMDLGYERGEISQIRRAIPVRRR